MVVWCCGAVYVVVCDDGVWCGYVYVLLYVLLYRCVCLFAVQSDSEPQGDSRTGEWWCVSVVKWWCGDVFLCCCVDVFAMSFKKG